MFSSILFKVYGACALCAPFVGKIFIDDVYSGGKKGDGNYPLLSNAIREGLFHPNCKDGCSTWFEGISRIKPVTPEEEEEMNRREKLAARQNYYENQAEKCERIATHSLDKDNKRTYERRAKINKQNAENIAKSLENSSESGIIKLKRNISSRHLPNGWRSPSTHHLADDEIEMLKREIEAIEADLSVFKFNEGTRTGYDDVLDEIRVKGDILPDLNSEHPRDRMSPRAALAHEYYGHRANRGTRLPKGSWNDEFRASYMAAKNCPNLTLSDRRYLILDALERAKEKGVTITYNSFIRGLLYGY